MNSALFIIRSPFQCLCMLEAIDFFKIESFDVLIPEHSTGTNSTQLKALLNDQKIPYQTHNIRHALKDLLPYAIRRRHKYYKNIFIGNYYSPSDEALAVFCGEWRYNVYFLDDGTQALSLFSETPRNRFKTKKWALYFRFIYSLGKLKGCRKPNYFTIFDVTSNKFNIIKNDFNLLKRGLPGNKEEVFIIGANSSILKFKGCTYLQLMDYLIGRIHNDYPGKRIQYCPHRRDSNNNEIRAWCISNHVEWYDTRVSVEYDFTTTGIYPLCVVGFTSNALYTLKMLFPESRIMTVFYHVESEFADRETEIIRLEMNRKGIETFYLL